MMVPVRCPSCGAESLVHARAAVTGVECSSCHARVRVGPPPPPPVPEKHRELAPLPPRRQPFPWGAVLLCLMVAGSAGWWWWRYGGEVAGKIDGSAPTATLAQALPRVVTGVVITDRGGKRHIVPLSQGTGFAISPTGDVLTSRKVVEQVWAARHRPAELNTFFPESEVTSVEPMVWLFLPAADGTGAKVLVARIVFLPADEILEIAVLRAPTTFESYFRLRREPPADMGGRNVFALGHPQQLVWEQAADGLDRIEDLREGAAAPHSVTRSTATRRQGHVIEHGAHTADHSTGGPLLDDAGLVLGICTGESQALAIDAVFDIVQQHAPGAVWD